MGVADAGLVEETIYFFLRLCGVMEWFNAGGYDCMGSAGCIRFI